MHLTIWSSGETKRKRLRIRCEYVTKKSISAARNSGVAMKIINAGKEKTDTV